MKRLRKSAFAGAFQAVNVIFLGLVALLCVLPVIHVLAVSFSSNTAVAAGRVSLFPVDINTTAYSYLLAKPQFWRSFGISVFRVLAGVAVNMLMIVLIAYPLSKSKSEFKSRNLYLWFFFFTALFSGGIIPTYMLVSQLHMMDTIWSLVLPTAVNMFNVLLLMNFFRSIPKELSEAAMIDGSGHFGVLFRIMLPCALPAVATLFLFCVVGHWNSWFDGLIYSNRTENYPLQSYLQTIIINMDFTQGSVADPEQMKELSDQTLKSAQIIIAMLPVSILYPFLQKYLSKGMILGSVKG